jgi:hypothetical protein
MKHLFITGLVAVLASVQPVQAQIRFDRDWDDRYEDRYDRDGRYDDRYDDDRYDAYNRRDNSWRPGSRYMRPIVWQGAAYQRPRTRDFAHEQSKNVFRRDGLSEIELWADERGTEVWLEVVDGVMQFERGEIIFRNGKRQPIDMRGLTRGRGFYPIVDFRGWREVSRLKLLARAVTPGARVGLHMME